MICNWNKRKVLSARIAKLVANGAAVNVIGADTSVLVLPSPRLQALVSVVIPPANNLRDGANPQWADRQNSTDIGGDALPATWQIYPLITPAPEIAIAGTLDPGNLDGLTRGSPVLELDAPADEGRAMRENHAVPGRRQDCYLLSGETTALWIIASQLCFINSPTSPIYAAVQAEITPAAGVDMSDAEWRWLIEHCELRSLTSSPTSPPVIASAFG